MRAPKNPPQRIILRMFMHCSPGKIALSYVKFLANATNNVRQCVDQLRRKRHKLVGIRIDLGDLGGANRSGRALPWFESYADQDCTAMMLLRNNG
jgi:hypothetical protein